MGLLIGLLIFFGLFFGLIGFMALGSVLGPQGNWIGDFEASLRDNGEI